jgi:TatD DNase family protein
MIVDTHCHLCDKRFDKDREDVLRRAFDAGVGYFVEIAYAPEIVAKAHALAAAHPNVYLCVGVHPSESAKVGDDYLPILRDHCGHARVVAVGETGLDFFRDYAPRADQERWFRAQLALADEKGLPVVIHQRSALHCFDDGPAAVARAQKLGFKLGLGGCLTYGHAELDAAVAMAPAEMLVLETDAPYLEPEPRSLRRNEPALLGRVIRRLCEIRGWTPDEAVRITAANSRNLFGAPWEVW